MTDDARDQLLYGLKEDIAVIKSFVEIENRNINKTLKRAFERIEDLEDRLTIVEKKGLILGVKFALIGSFATIIFAGSVTLAYKIIEKAIL